MPPPLPGPPRSIADMSTVTLEDGVAKQAAMRVSKDLAGIDIAARVTAAHLDELAGHHPAPPSKDLPSSSRRGTRTTADRPAGSAGWVAPDQTLPGASRRGTRTTSDRPAGSRRGTRASADQLMPFDGAAPDRLVAAARLPLVEEDVHQLERVAAFAAGERQPAPVVVSAASRSTASVPVAPALGQAEVLQEGAGSAAGRLPADAPAAWSTAQAQQQLLVAQLEAMSQLHAGGVPASAVQLVAVAQQQQQLTAQLEARGQLTAGTLQQVDVQQAAAGVASFPVRQQTSEASRETEGTHLMPGFCWVPVAPCHAASIELASFAADEDSSSGSESGSETESSSGSDRSEVTCTAPTGVCSSSGCFADLAPSDVRLAASSLMRIAQHASGHLSLACCFVSAVNRMLSAGRGAERGVEANPASN